MKPRATLKDYFKKGAIPKESDFADLIDSMLVQDEDSILKLPNDPLSIKATGAEEALLNFYRVDQGNNTLTWQMKQKEADKTGLSIHEGTTSRLFIESGTGSVGIGTTAPHGQFQVVGPPVFDSSTILHITNGATDHGRTNLVLTGRFNGGNDAWNFGTTARNSIVFSKNAKTANQDIGGLGVEQFSIQLEGNSNSLGFLTAQRAAVPALVIQQDGNVGIGTGAPEARLQVINTNTDFNGNTLILGPTSASNLRLGYNTDYSWVQSHGGKHLVINAIGNSVAIGTVDQPLTKLQVAGDIFATGKVYCVGGIVIQGPQNKWRIEDGNGWNETSGPSDARLKKDVQVLPHALQKVLSLRGVAYKWNDLGLQRMSRFAEIYDAGPGATEQEQLQLRASKREEAYKQFSGTEIGMIAQEVREIAPELVSEQADGYLGIAYERVVALLIEAIKDQQAMIEALGAKSAAMPVA